MPPAPGIEKKFRRWNVVVIAILVFFVLGVFVIAKAPAPSTTASGAVSTGPPVPHLHTTNPRALSLGPTITRELGSLLCLGASAARLKSGRDEGAGAISR
jgi:hypothetical protein